MGRDLVDVIYRWGAFSESDAANTALALLHYSYGLVGFAAVRVTVPIYYALKDSSLPMKISVASVVINMLLYYPLMTMLNFAGLAAATSIAGLVNFGLLLYYLPRKKVPVAYGSMFLSFVRIAVAATLAFWLATMLSVGAPAGWSEGVTRIWQFLVKLAAGGAIYLVLCAVLRVEEVRLLIRKLTGRR
jgi:putative peptidoglycan lipid II flippase